MSYNDLSGGFLNMATISKLLNEGLYEMSPLEAFEVFDKASRMLLKISGNEFIEKWNSGYFEPDPDDQPGVMEVASLMHSF
jgi:hypothetical protein